MDEKLFEGVITPLFLPLDEQERIIEHDLVKHVEDQLKRGINGLLVPSGTGEFFNLTADERRRSVAIAVQAAAGRAPVIAMVTDCGTRNSLSHAVAAREAGANAIMADPPYYQPLTQKHLLRYFHALADEGGLPLWLYQQPTLTKHSIEPQTVRELAEHPNLVGIKCSAWVDMWYVQQVVRALRDNPDFRVLMGEDINVFNGLALGMHGMVSTLGNLIPEAFVNIFQAMKKGDLDKARQIQDYITDVEELMLIECANWQSSGKYVLQKRGFFSTTIVSQPLLSLTNAEVQLLETKGKRLGLFVAPTPHF